MQGLFGSNKTDINLTIHFSPEARKLLRNLIDGIIAALTGMETRLMATLDEVITEMDGIDTALDSVKALIDGLRQQLADILSGANLPPEVQAKVDAVFQKAKDRSAEIAAALQEPTEEPPVEPPVESMRGRR